MKHVRDGNYFEPDRVAYINRYMETLGDVTHDILLDEDKYQEYGPIWQFPHLDNCQYSRNGVRCKVPAGEYFAMGTTATTARTAATGDSFRTANIVGKAFFIWMILTPI